MVRVLRSLRRLAASLAPFLVLCVAAAAARAQDRVSATLWIRVEGEDVKAALQIAADPGYHIGHGPRAEDVGGEGAIGLPTTLEFAGEGFEWGTPRFPEPEREEQDLGRVKTFVWVHYGSPVIWIRGRRTGEADPAGVTLTVRGQACDPNGCVPFKQVVTSSGAGSDKLFAKFPADLAVGAAGAGADAAGAGDPGAGATGAAGAAPAGLHAAPAAPAAAPKLVSELPLGAFLLAAVAAGLFALLMPCTYPMIPITISYFTKQAAARHTSILPLSLAYGAGIVVIFVALGATVGPAIIPFATHWVTNLVIGLFFVVFALSLFGLILIQPPQFLLQAAGSAARKGGYGGVFLMGATLVVTSFTCSAPFVGSLLAAGATNLTRVVLGMAVFGLTMAVPFVFLSLVPARTKALPKSGEWMHTLKVVLGFVELAAALKFISNVDLVLQWGVISRELFLLWWAGIFVVTALYLFGVIRVHEDHEAVLLEPGKPVRLHPTIGSGRMVAGVAFVLFALYNLHGAMGNQLDWVMTAMAPPYSTRIGAAGGGHGGEESASHTIVVDDLDAACARAQTDGKQVLINFTGFT